MKVLVVDDEEGVRESIRRVLELEGMEVAAAENGLSGQRRLQEDPFAAALIDLRMPGMDGLALLRWVREQGLRVPVIMISAYGEIQDAVEAMKTGARDYLIKPFSMEELLIRLRKVIEDQVLRDTVEAGRQADRPGPDLIGRSPAVAAVRELIRRVAATRSTVLLSGESGTGKEIAARLIHAQSAVGAGPFVAVNVGGLPVTLIESELFGYERGAFTGAAARKVGMFELASSGTLFLDEIGEMPPSVQVKLLRVLQDRRIRRLGGTQSIPVDARIVSATNRDPEAAVREGGFREDLFYRLNVVRIPIPPLRERLEDVPLLVGHFIEKFNRRMGAGVRGISLEALKKLQAYAYPGNVRELENVIERAFIFAASPTIEAADGQPALPGKEERPLPVADRPAGLKEIERQSIVAALHRWEGNRTHAAQELGISRRSMLYKIKEYGIDIPG